MKTFLVCMTLIFGVIMPFGGHAARKKDDDGQNLLCFVISGRKLPDTDNMGMGSPDGYVEIEYIGSPDAKIEIITTSILNNDHNPDWPEVFHIVYHPGKGQLLTFNVFDHNRFTDNKKIGYATVSVGEMINSSKRKLELDIVGPKKETGKLLLFMKVNETLYENTETRLRDPKAKLILIGGQY